MAKTPISRLLTTSCIWCFVFFFLNLKSNAQAVIPLEPYFDRLEPAQPNIIYGGMSVALAVNPGNDNEVIAATQTGGLMKSTDHGRNWLTLFNFPGGHWVRHVQYAPGAPNYVIAVTSGDQLTNNVNEGGIWLSRDGGYSWERPPSGIPPAGIHTGGRLMGNSISTFPGSSRVIVGTNMGIAISDNNGISWIYRNVPGTVVNSSALLRDNGMVISTSTGIFFWDNVASRWVVPNTPLSGAYISDRMASHNSFHVPSRFMSDVTTANPVFVVTSNSKIYLSRDGGNNWTFLGDLPFPPNMGAKGTVFLKMAAAGAPVSSLGLDLYVTNRLTIFRKFCPKTGPNFSYNFLERWQPELRLEHTDLADMCLDRDGNPWLLAGDGGVQKFTRNLFGDNFSFTDGGASRNGFHGLQITEVSGMYINDRREVDLYFATQDNNLYASENRGSTWTNNGLCCEGFLLEHARQVNAADDAMIGYVACAGCTNQISGRMFDNRRIIPLPSGVPVTTCLKYLGPNTFMSFRQIKVRRPGGMVGDSIRRTEYYTTSDYSRVSQSPSFSRVLSLDNIDTRGLPKKSATTSPSRHVLYQPYKAALDDGGDMGVIQRVKPMRMMVEAITYPGGASYYYGEGRYPANRNLGSIGVFPTEFAWYEVFAVNPVNNMHLIAADALNGRMVQSTTGGEDWIDNMGELNNLVTEGGTKPFSIGRFTNTSTIAFDPNNPQVILVGTRESGIFYSWNGGANWNKIPTSERIPEVSSFYFQNGNTVWASSYGRGLWKITLMYRPRRSELFYLFRNMSLFTLFDPIRISRMGVRPGGQQDNMDENMEYDQAIMVTEGSFENVYFENGRITGAEYTPNSSLLWYTDETYYNPPFNVKEKEEKNQWAGVPDDKIAELVKQGYYITGLLIKEGQLLDIIYAKEPLTFPAEKKYEEYQAIGEKEPGMQDKPYISLQSDNMMAGYCFIYPGQKLWIEGRNFDPQSPYPVQVLIDGSPTEIFGNIIPDKYGNFRVEMMTLLPLGIHTLIVQQIRSDQKLISDADEFMVAHRDEPLENIPGNINDHQKESPNPVKEKLNQLKEKVKEIIKPKN